MSPGATLSSGLERVWQNSLPILRERLASLDAYAATLREGGTSPAILENAFANAHKLAGTLGTFGFPAGSEAAARIEQHLDGRIVSSYEQLCSDVRLLHAIFD